MSPAQTQMLNSALGWLILAAIVVYGVATWGAERNGKSRYRKKSWIGVLASAMVVAAAAENHPYLAAGGFVVFMIYLLQQAIRQGNFRKADPEEARREGEAVAEALKKAEDAYWAEEEKRKVRK